MNAAQAAWWQTPQAWLYAWDFEGDCGRLLDLDRETLQRSSFLDHRIAADIERFHAVPIAELLSQPIREQATTPPGFIFHTAFCCSTLLARSLDLPGRTLALREPATLLQLADLKRGLTHSPRTETELLALTTTLLTRPFAAGERVLIKPTNLANNLAPALLAQHPGTRAIVLYDELEAFLLAVLKRPRESETGIGQFLRRLLVSPAGRRWLRANEVPESLAPRAALAWSLQMRELRDWLSGKDAPRVRVLAAGELLAAPAVALAACAAWLGVGLSAAEAANIARSALWTRHAKHPAAPYTPAHRHAEQTHARRLLAQPLHEALRWAENQEISLTADFPTPTRLLPY